MGTRRRAPRAAWDQVWGRIRCGAEVSGAGAALALAALADAVPTVNRGDLEARHRRVRATSLAVSAAPGPGNGPTGAAAPANDANQR